MKTNKFLSLLYLYIRKVLSKYIKNTPLRMRTAHEKLNVFQFFEIMHQNIGTVFNTEFGSVKNHVIIIHISPGLAGVFVIISSTLFICMLHLFFCGIMIKIFFFSCHSLNAVLFGSTHIRCLIHSSGLSEYLRRIVRG